MQTDEFRNFHQIVALGAEKSVDEFVSTLETLRAQVAEFEAIPTIMESPDGNPSWGSAKDAIRIIADYRRRLRAAVERAAKIGWVYGAESPLAMSYKERLERFELEGIPGIVAEVCGEALK